MSESAADEKQAIPNQVFVGGMTPDTTVEQLTKHFATLNLAPVGTPTFFLNPEGLSKGCALIPFGSPEDAKAAVTALENSDLAGQKLRAREDRGPKRPRRREQVNQDNSYVYVGNLDPAITQEELEALFAPFGKTQYVNISRKRRSENSLGWATVQLSSEEEAQKALEGLNGKAHKERNLTVEPLRSLPRKARARKEREPRDPNIPALENAEPEAAVDPTIVWVGNLAWSTTEEALQKLFSQHGVVKEVVVTRQKRSNQSRGWGTVTFETPEQATAAVTALNGTPLEERDIEVQIRRGPRRRRRTPREPRETNDDANTTERPRRVRRRRQPRAQNGDEDQQQQQTQQQQQPPRTNQRPRRQENKQPTEQATEEGKPKRRTRARRPRNDSQRNEENSTAAPEQNADSESKAPRRRRRRQRKAEDGTEGDANEDQQERRPRAERKEPERVVVDHPDRHVYVRNLAWEVTDEELKEFFTQCGSVANATVTMNTKGTSRGWGTVEMGSAPEAQKALSLDKQKFKERQLIVRLDKRVTGRQE
jgi:RNA recognition motif-containing protein